MNENYDIWLVIRARAVENKFHGWITFIDITSFHNRREARECKLLGLVLCMMIFIDFGSLEKEKKNEDNIELTEVFPFLFYIAIEYCVCQLWNSASEKSKQEMPFKRKETNWTDEKTKNAKIFRFSNEDNREDCTSFCVSKTAFVSMKNYYDLLVYYEMCANPYCQVSLA